MKVKYEKNTYQLSNSLSSRCQPKHVLVLIPKSHLLGLKDPLMEVPTALFHYYAIYVGFMSS